MQPRGQVEVVGRQAETATLAALVADVVAGRGGVAWLQGEPGIGKSTLVDLMAQDAQAAGCTLCRGAGAELMQAFPLRVLAECLGVSGSSTDVTRAEIARLLDGATSERVTLDPVIAAAERMLVLVDQLCAGGPVMLVVEDLQWADEPSLLVWNRLARAVDQIPLLLVGTCRPVPHRTTVERLRVVAHQRGSAYLELGPLDTQDVVRIAGRLAGGTPGRRLSAELVRAGGNPLYVRELVEAMVRNGLLDVVDDVAELRADAVATPASLTAAIGRRLGFLSDDTIAALRMAALLGHEFAVDQWAEVTGRQALDLVETTEEAVAAGVVSDAGQRLAFRHEVIRQVLVDQVPAPRRLDLHRHIAHTLVQRGAGVDAVARHLMAAPDLDDAWVAQWLAQSSESMLYAAPEVSAELLNRCVHTLDRDDPHWELLASRLATVLFWLGRDEQASEAAADVLRRTTDFELSAALQVQVLRSAGRAGRLEEALATAQPSLDDPRLPLKWRARLGAWSAQILALLDRFEEASARAHEALDDAGRSDDALAIGCARHVLAYVSGAPLQIAHIDAALAVLGDDPESMELRVMLIHNRIHRLVAAGRRGEADATLTEGLILAERIGTVRSASMLSQAAIACYYYGNWDDALLHLDSLNSEYLESPKFFHVHALTALIALHRGDGVLGERRLRAAGLLAGAEPSPLAALDTFMPDALGTWLEMNGELDQALAVRARWLDLPAGPVRDSRNDEAMFLVRAALAVGDTAAANAAMDALTPDAGSAPDHVLAARCCRALVDADATQLLDIAEEYRRLGWPLHAGFAQEEAALCLASSGNIAAARTAFNDALRTYADLGAAWDLRRAETRLRPYGIRRGSRTLARRATTGWEALTSGERRVAELVAQGLSNPDIAAQLFLSRNTVQTHVSHILAKLALRSRVELIQSFAARAHVADS